MKNTLSKYLYMALLVSIITTAGMTKAVANPHVNEGAAVSQATPQSFAPQKDLNQMSAVEKYRKALEGKIIKKWAPPRFAEKRSAVLRFELDRKGKLMGMKILQSSGVPALDESIQQALLKAAPFKSFPRELMVDHAPFEFTFDYVPKK